MSRAEALLPALHDAARYDREIDEYLHVIRPISDRFYPTPGNHDVISGDRDPEDTRFAERYRQRFGPLHYSVEVDDATVIVLFSDESMGDGALRLSDEQLAWLEQETGQELTQLRSLQLSTTIFLAKD